MEDQKDSSRTYEGRGEISFGGRDSVDTYHSYVSPDQSHCVPEQSDSEYALPKIGPRL